MMRELALASLLAFTPVVAHQASAACATTPPASFAPAVNEINQFRAQNGRAALCWNGNVAQAAQWLASDMAAKNYFSHIDSLGRDGGQRLTSFGYAWSWWGEDIAWGYASWHDAIVAWENSSGHRANLLSTNFKDVGLDYAYTAGGSYHRFYVADFGAPR